MSKKVIFLFLFLLLFIMGCDEYASPPRLLPEYVKKVSILEFTDPNNNILFTQKLHRATKDEFILDSRVELTLPNNADALLKGEVVRYRITPLSYDSNFVVKEYKLLVWINITFLDVLNKTILWTEKHMESTVNYKTNGASDGELNTEIEAQDILVKNLAKDIVKRTIDGWFAASGVSEKK